MEKEITVRTLKDLEHFKYLTSEKSETESVLFAQCLSSFQIYTKEDNYYNEATIAQFGVAGLVTKNSSPKVFTIATNGGIKDDFHFRKSLISLIIEKINRDVTCANALLKQLKEDGKIEGDSEISIKDIADKITIHEDVDDILIRLKKNSHKYAHIVYEKGKEVSADDKIGKFEALCKVQEVADNFDVNKI